MINLINSFLSHGDGWDFGTNVNLLALSGVALAYRFQSHGALLGTPRNTTGKVLAGSPTAFSNPDFSFGPRLQAFPRLQTGKLGPSR
jgi:hypothetical protein